MTFDDSTAAYYDKRADWSLIPTHMHEGVVRYVMYGIRPGSFMGAILANDFMEAIGRADMENAARILGWAQFIYSHTPRGSWGSYEQVAAWIAIGGMSGRLKATPSATT